MLLYLVENTYLKDKNTYLKYNKERTNDKRNNKNDLITIIDTDSIIET